MKRRREIREKTAAFGVKSLYSAALGDFKGEIIQKFTKELIDNRQREQIN
ncbi:hypothetical protein [Paenibacillus sp. MMS20-IR301]|nr:hypothetical protein [Paenibacillus sp. MMS20-IR301]WNS41771.1 hypothetical protein LOS79_22510 [Paenibacillus sp. MMS20-IR301]